MTERDDATQEGITLPPTDTARLIAESAARKIAIEHISLCPFATQRIQERVTLLETRFALLIGLMIGSGFIGGATAATLMKAITP